MISYGRVDYDFLARVGVVPAKNGSLKKALSDLYNDIEPEMVDSRAAANAWCRILERAFHYERIP